MRYMMSAILLCIFSFTLSATSDFIFCESAGACEVDVVIVAEPGSAPYLIAENLEGIPPFTYEWSTGELTGGIFPPEGGMYCVTMTDADGCAAENCTQVNSFSSNCDVVIFQDPTGGVSNVLGTDNSGTPDAVAWEWNTTETTNSIVVTAPGTYCVTVTFADGCLATDCYAYDVNTGPDSCHVAIEEFSNTIGAVGIQIVSPTGSGSFDFQWSNGQNSNAIIVTDSGLYCVTMTTSDGCVAIACENVTVIPPNQVDTCGINIIENVEPNGTVILEAVWPTSDIPSLRWNVGLDSNSVFVAPGIIVTEDGTYCVTATYSNGCVVTDCYNYTSGPANDCGVTLTEVVGSGDIDYVLATATGVPPFSFLWNDPNNSITHSILPMPSETYCVTITDANGCTAEDCLFVDGFESIQGYVWTDSLQADDTGIVYLIHFNPVDSILTLVDSTSFSSAFATGFYDFNDLQPGSYLVKAGLDENSIGYQNHLPTYHFDKLFWHEAISVTVPSSEFEFTNIAMVQGVNPGGPGFVGGYVTEGANKPGVSSSAIKGPGDPIANVSVLLFDVDDNPITHTTTDVEGRYEFDDLAYGTYQVFVEIFGKDQGMQMVTIDGNTPDADNINFNVNSTYTTTAVAEINEVKSLKLYPNPVTDSEVLNLAIEMTTFEELTIEVINVNGNKLFENQISVSLGVNIIELNTSHLNAGVYFLNIKSSNGVMTRKFIR